MTLEEKMGGPYTKQEQETRRNQVFELHFEQGHSAVYIAKSLDVNRNTINKDIVFLYTQLHDEKPSFHQNWLDKQLFRLDFQRTRLQNGLNPEISFKEKLQLEKSITHIDLCIAGLIVKIVASKKYLRL